MLKRFRLLQTSKQALSQSIKFVENPKSNSISDPSPATTHTNTSLPQLVQHGHHLSVTSSNLSASAGQSSPVILFALQDNFSDASLSTTDNATFGKNDSAFRKRLIASLDTQLRFLMKKLHLSLRVTGKSSYVPLFSLDASRVVTLIDRPTNRRGEPLNFLTGLIETSLSSKLAFDFLTNENTSHFTNNEEVQIIRDFIFRQSEMLRGRGSGAAGNSGSNSMSGVGTVAAAAIAAVTSSAAVKPVAGIELPSLDKWLSASTSILNSLTSLKINFTEGESENSNNIVAALSCLERGTSVNTKFSISWCESELPNAREVYLRDLPSFYRTCTHKEHLTKALEAFQAAVKGPAVSSFVIKLEKECNSIWENGRQQCDIPSLAGKPCMLQRHNMDDSVIRREHCSGYYFLLACACGRSRALRDDPFDIETANVKFCVLPKCEGLLPTVEIPVADGVSTVMAGAWRLMRVGGAGYYKPEKGLLQMGFCTREKYLFQWKIKNTSDSDTNDQSSSVKCSEMIKEASKKQVASDLGINSGTDLLSSTTKKPFSEVVAGTVMTDSEFPALQKMHLKPSISHKDTKQSKSSSPRNEVKNENKIYSGDSQIIKNVVPVINKDEGTKENKSMREFIVRVGFEHECPHGHRFLLSEKHLKGLDSPFLSEKSQEKNLGNKKGFPTKVLQSSTTKANKMKEVSVKRSNQPVHMSGFANENEKYKDGGRAFSLLNRKLPIFMNCPHCGRSEKQTSQQVKFAGTTSQLQRIFIVS